ncbi:rho family-interacting cell polarization regulator 1 isoform X2 [Ambystoma mexicanum]|uniref:rho family-interacting cell polarization regulator 1 isoform X2 n=1 Tax=Ambystoma mexicanum TaxID=8296 RepID=UPI0037E8DF9D
MLEAVRSNWLEGCLIHCCCFQGARSSPRTHSTMSLSVRPQRRILSTSINRSHSFGGVNSSREKPYRQLPVFSTPTVSRKTGSRVSRMFSMSHKSPPPKVPQPDRLDEVYEALKRGLGAYLEVHQLELDKLSTQIRESKRNSRLGFLYDLDKQVKSIERFLRRLEFHASKIDELYEAYCIQRRLRDGAHNMVKAYTASPGSKEARESQAEAGKGYKEYTENMCALESDLETQLGEFHVKMKGLAGFARLCAGDQYEIFMKYGRQRWKLKGRIEGNGKQVWDSEEMLFQPLITEFLSIKVTELKSLANHVVVGSVSCETKDLFAALPQVVAVDINDLGTIKLSLEVNWNPFDKDDQSSSASTVNKSSTVNKRFSTYNQSPPDTPSLREQAFYNMIRRQDDQENGAAWSISSESSDDSSSPQLSSSGRHSQKTIVQPEIQSVPPAIEIAFAQPEDDSAACDDLLTQAADDGQEPLAKKEVKREVVANGHVPYSRTLSHISEVSLDAAIVDSKEGKISEAAACITPPHVVEDLNSKAVSMSEAPLQAQTVGIIQSTVKPQTSQGVDSAIEPLSSELDDWGPLKDEVPVQTCETATARTICVTEALAFEKQGTLESHRLIANVEAPSPERQDLEMASHTHATEDIWLAEAEKPGVVVSHRPVSSAVACVGKKQALLSSHGQNSTAATPLSEKPEDVLLQGPCPVTETPTVSKPAPVTSYEQAFTADQSVAENQKAVVPHREITSAEGPVGGSHALVGSHVLISRQEVLSSGKECVLPYEQSDTSEESVAVPPEVTSKVGNQQESKESGTSRQTSGLNPVALAESPGVMAEHAAASSPVVKGRPVDVGLEEAINTLDSALEDYRGQFPELQTLEQEVKHLQEILMQKQGIFRSRTSSISLTVEHALESFDFLNATSDMDDSECSEEEGTERKVSTLRPDTGETASADTSRVTVEDAGVGSGSEGSSDPWTSGNEFLDGALVLHLNNCNRLLLRLGTFGPLRCREMYALDKLMREAQIMEIICRLTKEKSGTAVSAEEVVQFSTNKEGFLSFWSRCIESPNIYTTTVERFLSAFMAHYATQVNERHQGLAEPVFVNLAEDVLDRRLPRRARSGHSGHMTLFQYWSHFESLDVTVLDSYIQEMAEEVLFVQNLNSDDQDVVLKALKRVPESRIQREGLKALSLLLTNGNSKVIAAVSTLLRSSAENLKFRERALVCFLEQLEDEEVPTRVAGCAALGCVKAKESIEQLLYLCQTDKEEVRCAAKHSLMLFGEDGKVAYRHLEDSMDSLPRIFAPGAMASTAF